MKEFVTIEEAFKALNSPSRLPVKAIEFLHSQSPNPLVRDILIKEFEEYHKNYLDTEYFYKNYKKVFLYLIVADEYLCPEILDSLMKFVYDLEMVDLIENQVIYLAGLYAKKFPEDAAKRIPQFISENLSKKIQGLYVILYDALEILDTNIFVDFFIQNIKNEDAYPYTLFAFAQFKKPEALIPFLEKLRKEIDEKWNDFKENDSFFRIFDIEEFESNVDETLKCIKENRGADKWSFTCETRGDWKDAYRIEYKNAFDEDSSYYSDFQNPYKIDHQEISPSKKPQASFIEDSDLKNLLFDTIERNDKCPCGSGLKYKKCCGKNK